MFQPVEGNVNFPQQELAVGRFWKERQIYEKTLAARKDAPPFVFYEGPPTANGMPHPGHCLTRAIKDLFPRYKTMRGFRCERKAGWDTHGLPVEVEVCKELGIHSKEEIEAYGIEPFIQKCQQSVWRYMREWEQLTERIGFWVDLKNAYATYHQSFVESVWWSLKELYDRGLLYQGHKIVWWWAQGGTALSSGEVGEGYRQVADPSVYVKFPLLDEAGSVTDTSLLVWTTTPWTLPSNQFAAVNPDLDYVEVDLFREQKPLSESRSRSVSGSKSQSRSTSGSGSKLGSWSTTATGSFRRSLHGDEQRVRVFVAKELLTSLRDKFELVAYQIVGCKKGRDLIGLRYLPPFEHYYQSTGHHFGALAGRADARLGHRQGELLKPNVRGESIEHTGWKVVEGDFVTTESGTGVVHQAPAFGEADYDVLVNEVARFKAGFEPRLLNCVAPDGKFTNDGPEYCRGRWVKDCDKDIIRDLKQRGLLFHQEQYVHDYPFCPRAEQDALIQYPRRSWFIRTSEYKDEMLANNDKINWLPEHIRTGRFGKFLETNVDWALSRERYWGTPLPIWKCQATGRMEAVGSYAELMAKPGVRGGQVWDEAKKRNRDLPDDLRIHKPYIDEITYDSPFEKGAHMRRVPEVIDCWYDAGSMPFAQWGYQGEASDTSGSLPLAGRVGEGAEAAAATPAQRFHEQFPADFISEAIDQTRGWFYAQLAISTLLFGNRSEQPTKYPHPFRNCIVLGLMLGEDGNKMSKRKRNYLPPNEIFDRYGADALRWYFFANQPPWTSIRYSEQAIKDSIPEFLLRLWNVYSFFVIYANIDGFEPAKEAVFGVVGQGPAPTRHPRAGGDIPAQAGIGGRVFDKRELSSAKSYRPVNERSELDRWILSELHRTIELVTQRMDAYDNFGACQSITEFVDALSNWYVRRSRDRFWASDKRAVEKLDAYWTLYECLLTTTKVVAPFVPFLAETLWQNLAVAGVSDPGPGLKEAGNNVAESVHLCDYPTANLAVIDEALSERMNLVRLISSLGRNARTSAALKVRQPLSKVEVILADTTHQAWLEQHADVINEELNVKHLEFCDDPSQYVDHEVNPNFKLLGPKLGKLMPKVKAWLGKQSGAELLANFRDNRLIDMEIDGQQLALTRDEVEFRIRPKPGWTSANGRGVVVVLSTELTPELVAEGLARDVVRVVQETRKEIACQFTDRIELGIVSESIDLILAIQAFEKYIQDETLAVKISLEEIEGVRPFDLDIEPKRVEIGGHAAEIYVRVVK